MTKEFQEAVDKVKKYLEARDYSYGVKTGHMRCYHLLATYMATERQSYSYETAIKWLKSIEPELSHFTFKSHLQAIERFDMAYKNKEIGDSKVYATKQKYENMESWCKGALNIYMNELPSNYDLSYVQFIRYSITRFLDYAVSHGVCKLENITSRIIYDYYCDYKHENYKHKDAQNNHIRRFLRHLSDKGTIPASVPLTLDKSVLSRLIFVESLSCESREYFNKSIHTEIMSAKEYYDKAVELGAEIDRHNYSNTIRKAYRKTWKDLYIFLESNSLCYSHELALEWANYMRLHTVQWKSFRRAFMLFDQFRASGQINPRIVYSYKPDRVDMLPEWCKADYVAFIQSKRKDGLAESTLDMYRSSCLRLFEYLIAIGIKSWGSLTPDIVKNFHRQDIHSTPEGRNAYSYKIRRFLEHLGENGQIPPSLYMAVPCENAQRTDIIQTLSDTEIKNIYKKKDEYVSDAMGLRDMAMVLLGLRMGLRASDITNLKFTDISWEEKTVSVQQQKTDRFLKLPMTVDVGNALYHYIIKGRPESSSEHIFITHRVPYDKLHRIACKKALSNTLTDLSQGFHVTRKTFASRMLRNNVTAGRIAESLGHADNSVVMQYLSTDDEKMRMCALPLSDIQVERGVVI
jgi:integrase